MADLFTVTKKEIEIPCIVERVTFRKENGFGLLACVLNEYSEKCDASIKKEVDACMSKKWNTFTVSVSDLEEGVDPSGQQYIFCGNFVRHPKYGKQFESMYSCIDTPEDHTGFKMFLMGLPHIKTARADEILSKWSVSEVKDILTKDINQLLDIRGLTVKRIKAIKKDWDKHYHKMATYILFSSVDFSPKIAEKAFKTWGPDACKMLNENPYLLATLPRITFADADLFAHRLAEANGTTICESQRLVACISHLLNQAFRSDGQICIPLGAARASAIKTMEEANKKQDIHKDEDYASLFNKVLKSRLDLFAPVKNLKKEGSPCYLYLRDIWNKECFIGNEICKRAELESHFKCEDKDIEFAESGIKQFYGESFTLDDRQKDAIRSSFDNKITVITGGGGTGKTTICKCIYEIACEKNLSVKMMSPTGRAAQVLSSKTGCAASTVHRALKLAPGSDETVERLTQDIVLVDEISMSGMDIMFAIFCALKENPRANLIFVGDKDQLPSVSAGNFLFDLIASNSVKVIRLDKIHRQDENSFISLLANDIAKGKSVEIPKDATDINWLNINPDEIAYRMNKLLDGYLAKNDISDLQIISPMKKGKCGVYALNGIVQDKMKKFNRVAEAESIERGFDKFYLYDRIIQTENNYEKDIFNGDMGIIISMGTKQREDEDIDDDREYQYITVDFYGRHVTYYGDEINQVQLGWAITVHKFQGSQSKFVLLFMVSEASIMMTKELVYTGFTRAEKKLVIYGHKSCLMEAPHKSSIRLRYTNLVDIIDQIKNKTENFKVLE